MICDSCQSVMIRKCGFGYCTWVCGECGRTDESPDLLPTVDAWEIKYED